MKYKSLSRYEDGLTVQVDSKFLEFILKIFSKRLKRKAIKKGLIPKYKEVRTVYNVSISCWVKDKEKV